MLVNTHLLLQESANKRIKRMREINSEFEKMLDKPILYFKKKEWKRLHKEFDMLYTTTANECKAMSVIEQIMLGEK